MNQTKSPPEARPPFPPFTHETALAKIAAAENAWNTRDPQKVSLAYTPDCEWRNRDQFIHGRQEIQNFLSAKWAKEHDYRLRKHLWCFSGNRIAVTFEYEWHDQDGQWYRSHGNENWEFAPNGLMRRRVASINDQPIAASERKFYWQRDGETVVPTNQPPAKAA
ncbi:nuclear transport factor 2 family protein [Actomonas aquatica]|uniref:Nuclear transport factor 2 family protein n=1 Tax=Actomonas aquatica TaxID=2866162 RepID=A0ABZ1CAJ5_9BACT|nr:nuclear transport factor 2 family protein [Opitutus sp. WL0086]WRQ88709.1 nuclear transport factor 2 family protein [Opitutus sp. WL0086]